ncbi:MAG: hypothetical protein JWQ36_2467, partial [Enterovirga sp.]|nr:hypothetical protein [Enterovirga sp.]
MLRLRAPAAKRGSLRAVALTTAAAVPILFAAAAGLGILSLPSGQRDVEVTGSLSPAPLRIDPTLLAPVPMMGKTAAAGWSGVPVTPGTLRMPAGAVAASTPAAPHQA